MLGTILEIAIVSLLIILVVGPSALAAFRTWREGAARRAARESGIWPTRSQCGPAQTG